MKNLQHIYDVLLDFNRVVGAKGLDSTLLAHRGRRDGVGVVAGVVPIRSDNLNDAFPASKKQICFRAHGLQVLNAR